MAMCKSIKNHPQRHLGFVPTRRTRQLVGVVGAGYGYERVSYALPMEGFEFRTIRRFPMHRLVKQGTFWWQTPIPLDRSVGLLHTWNMVPMCGSPFVVSFENELPRYLGVTAGWQEWLGHRILASDRCRAILALSQTACGLARQRFVEAGWPAIAAKICVFRGGVGCPIAPRLEKSGGGGIRALFIGGNGFAKGLIPTVRAIERLRQQGADIRLTIVSSLSGSNYVLRHTTPNAETWLASIRKHEWITYYPFLANAAVLEQMRTHDVLLFPSLDETLGWVVIEAGLAGIPTIATNVFALPELVEAGLTGWIVPLDLGADHRWPGLWLEGRALEEEVERTYARIEGGLTKHLGELCASPDLATRYGAAAQNRMRAQYDPTLAASQLGRIYSRAISGQPIVQE